MQKSYPVLKMLIPITLLLVLGLQACGDKDTVDNSIPPPIPTNPINLTKDQLNELSTKTVLDMRLALETYFDVTGVIGREIYRFPLSESGYTTDLLGSGSATLRNNQLYIIYPWRNRYNVVKEAVQLATYAAGSTKITDEEKRGYTGIAKTIIAHELLMNLNLTNTNGVYINLSGSRVDSGAVVPAPAALDSVARFLDEAKAVLPGAVLPPLPSGFQDYNDVAGFIKFNRALAARVAVYRQQWTAALTALNESFFNLNGDLNAGPKHAFATYQGDILNPCFIAKNATGNVRLAHPSFSTDIIPGDDRLGKTSLRNLANSLDGLTSNRDVWVYPANVTSIPIIRNEELILIYAEAKVQNNSLPDAIVALNRIRTAHSLSVYGGGFSQAALITEMLNQRRFSLAFEGHYWVDMRRYSRLNQLPVDRTGDDVWDKLPLPILN